LTTTFRPHCYDLIPKSSLHSMKAKFSSIGEPAH
jgi:hypothetical protein